MFLFETYLTHPFSKVCMYKPLSLLSCFLFIFLFLLSGCDDETVSSTACGDGTCDALEAKKGLCPEDCGTSAPHQDDISIQKAFAGDSFVAFVPSEGIGNIAVQVTLPETSRYDEGAPVLLY